MVRAAPRREPGGRCKKSDVLTDFPVPVRVGGQREGQTMARLTAVLAAVLVMAAGVRADSPRSAKEALQPFNDLIGSWKATCTPEGTAAERQAGFWVERVSWEWQFKAGDAWLKLAIDNGKLYKGGELRYQPASDDFKLTLQPLTGPAQTFTGKLAGKKLTLDRTDGMEAQRLTVT